MTLPDFPGPHENPWFDKRQAFDLVQAAWTAL